MYECGNLKPGYLFVYCKFHFSEFDHIYYKSSLAHQQINNGKEMENNQN